MTVERYSNFVFEVEKHWIFYFLSCESIQVFLTFSCVFCMTDNFMLSSWSITIMILHYSISVYQVCTCVPGVIFAVIGPR